MAFKHTKIPNSVFDVYLTKLSESELKIYLLIARYTIGWNKKWVWLANSQLAKNCGLSETSVRSAIKSLISKKLLSRRKNGNSFEYCILISSKDSLTIENKEDIEGKGSNFEGSNFEGSNFDPIKRKAKECFKEIENTHTTSAREDISEKWMSEITTAYPNIDIALEFQRLKLWREAQGINESPLRQDLLSWLKKARPVSKQNQPNEVGDIPTGQHSTGIFGRRDYAAIRKKLEEKL
ncbi:MAG: replication protein [Pyrinomonadaceae bacterium]|nr:replication protein [Pyrinomonadaceae bacterium]